MGVECELTVEVSFTLEDEALKDTLLERYMGFGEEFAAAGFGRCGPPLILLPSTVESEGVEMLIPGTFKFNCNLTLSMVEQALKLIRESFPDINPAPGFSVTLHDRESRSRIRLYPHSDIENYLSGM